MAFCIKCGRELEPGANFCHHCGQQAAPIEEEASAEPAPEQTERKLTPSQIEHKIYRFIKRHRGVLDVRKCVKRLGISEDEVERAVRALVAKGRLEEDQEAL